MLEKKLKSRLKLISLFKKLNIKNGDNVVFHSNIAGLYQFEKKINFKICDFFLKFILEYIGPTGTLLIPTYNYKFTQGKKYSRKKSVSQVGTFGNLLIKKYFKSRTFAPIFNHLVFGNLKDEIFNCDDKETFGDNSVFSKLIKKNFKIICFCCSANSMTFIHFIEKKMNVNYRFNKFFTGFVEKKKIKIKYFAGKKKFDYIIKQKKILNLIDNKQFIEASFGKFKCYSVNTNFLFKKLKKKILKKNNYLIDN